MKEENMLCTHRDLSLFKENIQITAVNREHLKAVDNGLSKTCIEIYPAREKSFLLSKP